MICVDQTTGSRTKEPLRCLAAMSQAKVYTVPTVQSYCKLAGGEEEALHSPAAMSHTGGGEGGQMFIYHKQYCTF